MNNISREITLFFGCFLVFFVLSFSFPFQLFPDLGGFLQPVMNKLILAEADMFGMQVDPFHSGEDSLGMLFNTINIFLLALIVYAIIRFKTSKEIQDKLSVYGVVLLRYYLGVILLIYGFDKVYKWQFYSPESNILYTKVKDLPQDMLYWTAMGTSYSYSLFSGIIEVCAGFLLLFRKTYVLGATFAFGVMLNVFAVNIGFDITVKLFSGFLLLLSLVLLIPHIIRVGNFFMGKSSQLEITKPVYASFKYYLPIKVVLLVFILIETQYKYIANGNFNDDLAPRPHFNGVYEVLNPDQTGANLVHFHRHGYMIFQNDDQFSDYKLTVDTVSKIFTLMRYDSSEYKIIYKEKGDTLWMKAFDDSKSTFSIVALKQHL